MQPVDDISLKILDEIGRGESRGIEFEAGVTDDGKYLQDVVAFSNGVGGRILFGVDDDGTIIGIPDDLLFSMMDSIADSITSSCRPLVSSDMFNVTIGDMNVIVVDVIPGRDTPYHLESEGRIRGTYVRLAGRSKLADPDMLRSLEIRGAGESFDRLNCPGTIADGDGINRLCGRLSVYGTWITPESLEVMGVLSRDVRGYVATNAYALLTGNPFPHARIQCARFSDNDGLVCTDSADLEDDIISQVEGAHAFILKHLDMRSETDDLAVMDHYEIPSEAVREAIVNAVVHRDYSLQTCSISVRVFDDRVEVESPGLLLMDASDLATGRSAVGNRAIASVFKAIGFIDRYGRGTRRMIELCEEQGCEPPGFNEEGKFFKVTFSRRVRMIPINGKVDAIIECIRGDPSMTQPQISEETGIPLSTVKKIMMRLRNEGRISREGSRKSGIWLVNRLNDVRFMVHIQLLVPLWFNF